MDVSVLKRDRAKIRKAYTINPDYSVTANRALEVHIPKRFTDNGMAVIGDKVTTVLVAGLVIPGEAYSPWIALVDVTLAPSSVREVGINGVLYYVLEFEEGDTLIENLRYIQDPNRPYSYFMEFDLYAKLPWFMSDRDLTSLYDNAAKESGGNVGGSPQHMRVYCSLMFRDPDNLDNAYRHSKAMLEGRPPVIVGLNNSSMLIDGTIPKLTGGFLQDNTLAAIIKPDTKTTDLELIVKGVPG